MKRSVIKDVNGKKLKSLDIIELKESYDGETAFIVTDTKPLTLTYNRSYDKSVKEHVKDVRKVLVMEFEIIDNVVDIAHAIFDKAGIKFK
jgi:hypothetical protein